ncbi:hypothetical protein FA13DRAFT_1094808 [Coprinellus micaceus]|uniref:Uncharacterized protein n=1 Tax=Coprinellus micaceus TaxID=71717 RepID=A0A4Y7SY54_COPMI|nr:hypothetical protein FA13DRAFT_1094808 [Coprinellus micaceus]
MERRSNAHITHLLRNVQRGSIKPLWSLLEDWPKGSALPVTQSVLSILTFERQPAGNLDVEKFDHATAALLVLSRAMHEASREHADLKPPMTLLLLPRLDCIVSWISLCFRYGRNSDGVDADSDDESEGTEDEDPACKTKPAVMCVVQCGMLFCDILGYDPRTRIALQSSRIAAEFMVSLWLSCDTDTGRPLFMLEPGVKVAQYYGCSINNAWSMFSGGSEAAKVAFLKRLYPDGNDTVVATKLIKVGIARLERMREACEQRQWESLIIGRNIRETLKTFEEYLALGIPEVLRAFHGQSFLGCAMATVCSLTRYLASTQKSSALGFSLTLLLDPIQSWPSLPGASPLDAMCLLIEGGLVNVLVDILVGVPWRDCKNKLWEESLQSLCTSILVCLWVLSIDFSCPARGDRVG